MVTVTVRLLLSPPARPSRKGSVFTAREAETFRQKKSAPARTGALTKSASEGNPQS